MFRMQLKRHRSGFTQPVALFFATAILIASIGRTKATALRLTPPPAATDGGLFSFWLVDLMLAAVAFAGTTSLLFFCAKRSKEGTTPTPKVSGTANTLPLPAAVTAATLCGLQQYPAAPSDQLNNDFG